MKLVILDIANGNLDEGYPVTIRIGNQNRPFDLEEREILPPAPEIATTHQDWRYNYTHQGQIIRWYRLEVLETSNISSKKECLDSSKQFLDTFQQWLNLPAFWRLREKIALYAQNNEPIKIVIQTQDLLLRRLPWHEWNLLDNYPLGEIVLSGSDRDRKQNRRGKMRILAAFGSNEGIDLKKDREILQNILPDAKIVYLPERDEILTRENLSKSLWDKEGWDILFFAGHSISEEEGKIGRIFLNSNNESMTIDELKNALKRSIERGLKLAIFNSCDGLGLAHQLATLQIPNVVVMREPLPDKVAHEFLHNLLENLKDDEDLNLAVRHARERLQSLENDYPCATWLPVICQHPQTTKFKYRQLPKLVRIFLENISQRKFLLGGMIAVAIFGGLIEIDKRASFDRRFSQGEKIVFLNDRNDDKQKGVDLVSWGKDSAAKQEFQQSLDKYPDDPETRIYLNNTTIGDRPTIEIAVVVPAGNNPEIGKEILRGIAIKQAEINNKGGVKGKYLKIEIVNDDNNEQIAKKVAERLVEDNKTVAVIGHNSTNASLEAADLYKDRLVMITPTSTAASLTSDNQDKYIYRAVLNSQDLGKHLGNYAKENYKTVFICQDSRAKDRSFVNHFKDAVGNNKISPIDCNFADNKPLQNIVKDIVNVKADAIFLSPYVNNISQAIDLAKAIDKEKIDVLGNVSLSSSTTLKRGNDTAGMVLVAPWDANNSNNKNFLQESQQIWKTTTTTTWRSATAYDALGIIAKAVEENGDTRDSIQKSLANPNFSFQGITGEMKFSSSGDLIGDLAPKPILQQLQCKNSQCSYQTIDLQFKRHSLGEKILFSQLNSSTKQQAVELFAEGKYLEAIQQFNTYLTENPNDPEARVYLNNAKAALAKGKLRIAVPIPIGSNPKVAAEMLRGVAQVQEELVKTGGIDGKLLELRLFNDDNNEAIAHKLAQEIVKDPTILAVIGHNASNASIVASKIYDANDLVAISPTSLSTALDSSSNGNIFRMTPKIELFADLLANYILQTSPQAKFVFCYDSGAPDNIPFKNAFQDRLQAKHSNYQYISLDCKFDAPNFDANKKIEEIIASGADSILLTPYVDRLDLAIDLAKTNNGRLKLFGSPTLYLSRILESGGEAFKGLTIAVPWFPDTSNDRAFPKNTEKLWKTSVGWRTANSYDAARTIVNALKQNPQRQGLNRIFRKPNFNYTGVTGDVKFASGGERNSLPDSATIIQIVPDSQSSLGFSFEKVDRS
jgi:branched-chain amino acid transport system substrate-binding protein